MKRPILFLAVVSLSLWIQSISANETQDYAWRWPITSLSDSSASLIQLTPEFYQKLNALPIDDLAVFDATGARMPLGPMPSWAMPEETLSEQPAHWSVKYFPPIPKPNPPQQDTEHLNIQIDGADGSRIRVERNTPNQVVNSDDAMVEFPKEMLRDRGPPLRLNEQGRARFLYPDLVATITLDNLPEQSTEVLHVRWISDLAPRGMFRVSILNERGERIAAPQSNTFGNGLDLEGEEKLTAPGLAGRTLLLEAFLVDPSFKIKSIKAYAYQQTSFTFEEQSVATLVTSRDESQSKTPGVFFYTLPGPLPLKRAHVRLNAPGNLTQIQLHQRANAQAPWQLSGSGEVYQLHFDGIQIESGQLVLTGMRGRELRLSSNPKLIRAPEIALTYRPDYLVFLNQGKPPYFLYAGSAQAKVHDDSELINQLIRTARTQFDPHWLPPKASLGTYETAAGEKALITAPTPRDWKSWILWALLVAVAGVIIFMALSLIRAKP
jgi:hypothetical protein